MTDQAWSQKLHDLYLLGYELGLDVTTADEIDVERVRTEREALVDELQAEVQRLNAEALRHEMTVARSQTLWAAAIKALESPLIAQLVEAPTGGDLDAEKTRECLRWLSRAVMASSEALRPAAYPHERPPLDEQPPTP